MFNSYKSMGLKVAAFSIVLGLTSCGGDQNDPDVISREDLKSPGGLTIADLGGGNIQLRWYTSNYEDDFEGYNIYGAAGTAAELGVTEGQPIELLDAAGNAVAAAKSTLALFSYQSSNTNALPGTDDLAEADISGTGDLKFSAFPYHKLRTANKEPNLPSCRPGTGDSGGQCAFLGSEKSEIDSDEISSLGALTFNFPPAGTTDLLTIGQSYCFFVFAVQDEGKEISQASSNVECIVPKYKTTISTSLTNSSQAQGIAATGAVSGLQEFRTTCATNCPSTVSLEDRQDRIIVPQNSARFDQIAFQLETYNDPSISYIVSGNNAAIMPLGYFANGFSDINFIEQISRVPALDLQGVDATENPNGYSIEGQSVPLYANNIYVLASGDQSSSTPTSFYYDWFYVSSLSCTARPCEIELEVLLSKDVDIRQR